MTALDLNTMTMEDAARYIAERNANARLGEDPAGTIRAAAAARRDATDMMRLAVEVIFGKKPYSGYFGWDWRYDEKGDEVVISAWTYGGYMDRERQPLSDVRFALDDLAGVVAGAVQVTR